MTKTSNPKPLADLQVDEMEVLVSIMDLLEVLSPDGLAQVSLRCTILMRTKCAAGGKS